MSKAYARGLWMVVALLAVALLLAACGPTSEPTAEPAQPTSEPTAEPTQPPPEPPTAEPTEAVEQPTSEPEPTKEEPSGQLFPPEMPSAVRGKTVFAANCASCHGEAGDGSGLTGAADFTDVEFMRHEKPAGFFEAIRDGVEGTAMPAWGGTLSEMEMWDVLYYE